jgi:hypothetical protein
MTEMPASVDFVWEQAERRLDAQMRQAEALDTKAGALVGVHALAASLVASVSGRLSQGAHVVAVAIVLGLLVSGGLAFAAYRSEAYDRNPSPEDLWRFAASRDDVIRYRFLSVRLAALQANQDRLTAKARRISWSLTGLGVVALVVAISAIVGLVT